MATRTSTDPLDAIDVAILCLQDVIEDSTPSIRPLISLEIAKLQRRIAADYDAHGIWHAHE